LLFFNVECMCEQLTMLKGICYNIGFFRDFFLSCMFSRFLSHSMC